MQLEPLIVLISVLFGSALFGVLGALLAIPVAAAIQITIREYVTLRRLSLVPGATPGRRYTWPRTELRRPVTPNRPGPTCAPMTGPISDTNSGSRP